MPFNHSDNFSNHTLHAFDAELDKLHDLLLGMTDLLIIQLEQSIQSLENADVQYAQNAIALDKEIDHFEIKIDAEVLQILAKFSPVANDLRTIISISKMVVELEKIGDEFANFATLVIQSFDSQIILLPPALLDELTKAKRHILSVLNKLRSVQETEEADLLYSILETDLQNQAELHQNIQCQLINLLQNNSNVGMATIVMQMNKMLEICGSQCRHIAEHMIFMIDRVDVRHQRNARDRA